GGAGPTGPESPTIPPGAGSLAAVADGRSGSVDDASSVDGWSSQISAPVAEGQGGSPVSTTDRPSGPIGGPSGGGEPGDTDLRALAGLIGGRGVTAEQRMLVAAISTTTTAATVMA